MLRRVKSENRSYLFDGRMEPVMRLRSGDEVIFETVDARGGRAMDDSVPYAVPPPPPYDRLNPVTGPISIEGAERGDTLAVEVKSIKLGRKGYTAIRDDQGVLKEMVGRSDALIIRVVGNRIDFGHSISFPTRPMIGTIGVAPADGAIPSVRPGAHGGNMDCNDIRRGARVYLPVNVDGAKLALGDVHASMGDGETSGAGLDIGADVRVKLRLLKHVRIEAPIIETESYVSLVHNSKTLEDAVRGAVSRAVSMIQRTRGISTEEAIALVSVACDLGICQSAMSPLDMAVRVRLPKEIVNLRSYVPA